MDEVSPVSPFTKPIKLLQIVPIPLVKCQLTNLSSFFWVYLDLSSLTISTNCGGKFTGPKPFYTIRFLHPLTL